MPDREKVIKGVECHRKKVKTKNASSCLRECPYSEPDPNREWCIKGLMDDIYALLKEQEAVEPNPVHNSLRWFACGKCDCSITREDRFCPRCGRQVKWE